MKKKEKIWIAILLVITIVVIIFAVTRKNGSEVANTNSIPDSDTTLVEKPEEKFVDIAEDGTKVNTSEALKTNKTVGNVEFSDIQLTQKNGETVLIANAKNTGSTASEMFAVDITLIDENGNDLVTVTGLVAPLSAGATTQFETSMTLDFANAYDFRVSAK